MSLDMGLSKQLRDPCARADLGCVCIPKLGCLYCLLGSHPSRSVSLCLDIKGKNWRTGNKLESLYRQGSLIILLLLDIFTELIFRVICGRAVSAASVSKLDQKSFFFFFNSCIPSGRSVVWSSLAGGPREVTDYRGLCVSACGPVKVAR